MLATQISPVTLEWLRATPALALVRASGAGIAGDARLVVDGQALLPLPDPTALPGDERAAWAVPLGLLDAGEPLAIEVGGELVELPMPTERALPADCRAEVVVHRRRPYLKLVSGIVTIALIPLSLATPALALAPAAGATALTTTAAVPPASPSAPPAPESGTTATPAATPAPPPAPPVTASTPKPAAKPAPASEHAAKPKTKPAPAVAPAPRHPKPHAHRRSHEHMEQHHVKHIKHAKPHPKPKPHAPSAAPAPAPAQTTAPATVPMLPLINVPDTGIDKWEIPPFLLPIYQAAGSAYGVPWQVLAAINHIETDYGRNVAISSAGAQGWMQFMPSTWEMYGLDATGDGKADPNNPVDAIFASARYLRAAGADKDLRRAIFAYNHADWYVDQVLADARSIAGLPTVLVDALTSLTQGRLPVAEMRSRYRHVGDDKTGLLTTAKSGAAVVAVTDGKVVEIGQSTRWGRFVVLEDAFGNRFRYGHLGRLMGLHAVPKERKESARKIARELHLPPPRASRSAAARRRAAAGSRAARAWSRHQRTAERRAAVRSERVAAAVSAHRSTAATSADARPEVLTARSAHTLAHAERVARTAALGRLGHLIELTAPADWAPPAPATPVTRAKPAAPSESDAHQALRLLGLKKNDARWARLRRGSRIPAGTLLGRVGSAGNTERGSFWFSIRPAGTPTAIDPQPFVQGWRMLERASGGENASARLAGLDPSKRLPAGALLLLGQQALERRVLQDPRIQLYECGRHDIATGQVDRRVLALLEYLAASGLHPTVSALKCGHSYLTASGNVSEHSSGDAVDIAAINGIPITGHQGPGSITDQTIRRMLQLQGTMSPHQIISLMKYPDAPNTMVLPDHYNHIHVGFHPGPGEGKAGVANGLNRHGWDKLLKRLGTLREPTLPTGD